MKLIFKKILSDEDIANKEGEYFDQNFYTKIINKDCDGYTEDGNLLFKFRKKKINSYLTNNALEAFLDASKKLHDNRGAAAGVLEKHKLPKYVGKWVNPGKFRTYFISKFSKKKSKQLISNRAPSNIAGYYDKPDRNIGSNALPCRMTAFTKYNSDKWNMSIPFLKRVDRLFKYLVPSKHELQRKQAQNTKFVIDDTAYSTITINHNWRTALHKDAGDFKDGFGNLIVCEDGKFDGGYLGFPQYGVCINVKNNDFLAMDVHEWHCNTELKPKNKDKKFNRLSIVCYLRENMLRCKDLDVVNFRETKDINYMKSSKKKLALGKKLSKKNTT